MRVGTRLLGVSMGHKSGVQKRLFLLTLVVLLGALSFSAVAELQQVSVGGEIRIRGRYYSNAWEEQRPLPRRIADNLLPWRPIGPTGTMSKFKWNSRGKDWTRYESSVLLNVQADFTDDVSAFIELYDFHIWGEEFRSNYLTGADSRANNVDFTIMNQAWIEMGNLFDQPLKLRVGRQNLHFGGGWLLSRMMTPSQYISFDAIRATYSPGDFTIDAFASKLDDNDRYFKDSVNLYGIYGTYTGIPEASMSLYWLYVRDSTDIPRSESTALGRWVNNRRGLEYGSTKLHTLGYRLFGGVGGLDYNLELAYQWGDANHLGSLFKPAGRFFGDTRAKYDNFAVDATVGYTFKETSWQPRLYVQGVVFSGEDNRDINFGDWLNPFYRPKASVSFNRLFTDKNYMATVNDNSWVSNFMQLSAGIEVQPTEKLRIHVHVAKDWVYEPFNPPKSIRFGRQRAFIAPNLSFWTDSGSRDLGWEVAAFARYNYSPDLWFMLYGNYLWTGEALTRGSFIHFYGTEYSGGSGKSNAGYLFWMACLKF
ncbi:MAG: alginate export family protein [Candidatus Hydrogenedens sp.]|nr:alginate export family protein [Candidatus Hydrogenedens sp.]